MIKKLLTIIGVLLLIGAITWGGLVFLDRHRNKELVTPPFPTPTEGNDSEENVDTKAQEPAFNKKAHSTTDPSSIWIIVNKTHPLSPINYAPSDLVDIGSGEQMSKEAAEAYARMAAAAKADAAAFSPLSGYRSYSYQSGVYNGYVKKDGEAKANTYSAKPGQSEHQTGLAVDIGTGTCNLEICFKDTKAGKWATLHAYEYGFIVRYQPGKEDVTGYQQEPWHLRYIGTDLSKEIHSKNVSTLEEFFGIN